MKKLKCPGRKPDLFRLCAGECRAIYSIKEGNIWITGIIKMEKAGNF
jgi:hypothetical protein